MSLVSFGVELEATTEETWEVVCDPRNLPQWDRHIVEVEGVPKTGLAAGMRYTTVMKFLAVRARVACAVLEWEPPRRSVIHLSGLLEATVSTTVTSLPGHCCWLEHEIDYVFHGGHLGELAARSLRLLGGPQFALRHGTLAQKRQIEGG